MMYASNDLLQDDCQESTQAEIVEVSRNEPSLQNDPFEKTLEDAEILFLKTKEAFEWQKLDEAYRLMKNCHSNLLMGEEKVVFDKYMDRHREFLQSIDDDYNYMQEILKQLDSEEDWNLEKEKGSYRVLYKKMEGALISVRLEAEVDIPLINMITLCREVDLWHLWIPFLKKTADLKEIHRGAKVYYIETSLPYPLANRECHIHGCGVNRLSENGTVLIMAKSIDNNVEFLKRHDIKKVEHTNTVAMDIQLGGFEVTALGPNKIKFRGVANINPNFSWLPDKVLNFVVRKGSMMILNKIVETAKKFEGSPWEAQTLKEKNREFYDWLKKETKEYFEKQK